MAEGPIDLIRMDGQEKSLIVRITGTMRVENYEFTDDMRLEGPRGPEVLVGEILVDTPFVRGSTRTTVFLEELWEWRDALDGLDAGHDIAWREISSAPALLVERDAEEGWARVTVRDRSSQLTTVTFNVDMADSWFDDAYERLDLTLKTWPLKES